MKYRWGSAAILLTVASCVCSAFGAHSGLTGADGESIFTPGFIQDYDAAQKSVGELKSAKPLLALLTKYTKPEERAELELSIGLVYNQRFVDNAKAITHLSRALEFSLPEKTYIEICMWRGNSYEQLKKHPEAIRDYLRGLLACSYWDLSGAWPEMSSPAVPIYMNADERKNAQRARDYRRYQGTVDLKRFLLMQRYYLIDAIKRVQVDGAIDDKALKQAVRELTPDKSRHDLIIASVKSKNKQPWP